MSTNSTSLSWSDKLKNKVLYQIEKTVNDPEANQFVEEKKKEEKKEETEKKKEKEKKGEKEKETQQKTDAVTEPLENDEPESSSPVVRVFQQIVRYAKKIVEVGFFPFIAFLLASLVANEMIVYPAPVRLIFFIFTLGICLFSRVILLFLGSFYLCKRGYDYYVNEMSDGPKRIIMPTLFALLPLTTKEYPNRLVNALAGPFQYGGQWSKPDGKELEERMKLYEGALHESFPFIDAIKTQEPYSKHLQKLEQNFAELHRSMAPPSNSNSTPPTNSSSPSNSSPPTNSASAPAPPTAV